MSIELPSTPKTVCIIRLSAIGDTVHTLPVVRTLMQAWPDAQFTWVIGKVEASLMQGIEGIDFVIFDKSKGMRAYRDLRRVLGTRFDLLLHMHPSMRANLASLCTRSNIRLGFDRARAKDQQWLFTNRKIEARAQQHVMDGLFGFAEALRISERDLRWDIPVSAEDREFAARHIDESRPALVISPCSSQRIGSFRNWNATNYVAVAEHAMREFDAQILVTGSASALEIDYAQQIETLGQFETVNLVGKTTLKQLLCVFERASLLICPDSGPAHMANAVRTPVIGLYAATNKLRAGPYFFNDLVVDKYPEAVSQEFGKQVSEVPWGTRIRNADAMALIGIQDVTAMIDKVLGAQSV